MKHKPGTEDLLRDIDEDAKALPLLTMELVFGSK